jgi:hypothetical protein
MDMVSVTRNRMWLAVLKLCVWPEILSPLRRALKLFLDRVDSMSLTLGEVGCNTVLLICSTPG